VTKGQPKLLNKVSLLDYKFD